jgi:hypothetical protein
MLPAGEFNGGNVKKGNKNGGNVDDADGVGVVEGLATTGTGACVLGFVVGFVDGGNVGTVVGGYAEGDVVGVNRSDVVGL